MNDNEQEAPSSLRRFPAEWERHDCVLLAWPHEETDWAYMLDETRTCIARIVKALAEEECVLLVGPADLCLPSVRDQGFDPRRVKFVDIPTNDTWARDFGALTVEADASLRLLDFKFNGWGLKFAADKDNLITSRLAAGGIFSADVENHLNFVLEGGSVESDGEGTLKKYIQRGNSVVLHPFNPAYEEMVIKGEELDHLYIAGKVVETKAKW